VKVGDVLEISLNILFLPVSQPHVCSSVFLVPSLSISDTSIIDTNFTIFLKLYVKCIRTENSPSLWLISLTTLPIWRPR